MDVAQIRPISFRLDREASEALAELQEQTGLDRSGAIRVALVETAERRRHSSLAAEAAALAADALDRKEMAEVAALMESLHDPR